MYSSRRKGEILCTGGTRWIAPRETDHGRRLEPRTVCILCILVVHISIIALGFTMIFNSSHRINGLDPSRDQVLAAVPKASCQAPNRLSMYFQHHNRVHSILAFRSAECPLSFQLQGFAIQDLFEGLNSVLSYSAVPELRHIE